MAFHWIPPNPGTLKINVHGVFSHLPSPVGSLSGIGAVYRNSHGGLRHVTVGTIPFLSRLGTQLWAVYAPLRCALVKGYKSVIIETDNLDAYRVIKNFQHGVPPQVYDLASQIDILIRDKRWTCVVSYVFPARNSPARFVARLGRDVAERLYTLDRSIGSLDELLDWDMGLGVDHPDFMDVLIPDDAPDPVNFDVALGVADQAAGLALGQVQEHAEGVNIPEAAQENGVMHNVQAAAGQNVVMANGVPVAMAFDGFPHVQEVEEVAEQEEVFHAGITDGLLFAGDPPLDDID